MGPKFGEYKPWDIRPRTLREETFWSANKTSFSQISLRRFGKNAQFLVLRFDLCWHKCNPFSFDVHRQVQREKFMKKGASAFFHPVAQRWVRRTHTLPLGEERQCVGCVMPKYQHYTTTHCNTKILHLALDSKQNALTIRPPCTVLQWHTKLCPNTQNWIFKFSEWLYSTKFFRV